MDILLTIILGIFFIIIFPLGELARIDLPNNVAITGIDVGVVLLVVAILSVRLLWKYGGPRQSNLTSRLLKPLIFFLGIGILSLLINIPHLKPTEVAVSFLYLVRFAMYAGVYFAIGALTPILKKKTALFMLISGAIMLILGYAQYFLYPSLRNLFYLGWDVHLYRMFGSFLDPNFFGAFLVLYLLFLLGNGVKSLPIKLLLIIGTVVALVLTYSRSAYLMCIVGIVTFFIIKKPSKMFLYGAGMLTILAITSYFLFTKYSEGTNLFRVNSTKARVTTSGEALKIFQQNPILGVGFNAYRYAQNRYGFSKQNVAGVALDHAGAGTVNSFLFVLATTGIIGFAAYLYLLWSIVKVGKTNLNENPFSPVLISSVIALCVDAFFINSLFYPFILVWMWLIVQLSEAME